MGTASAKHVSRLLLLTGACALWWFLSPALAADGPEIYAVHCAQCHQPNGEADLVADVRAETEVDAEIEPVEVDLPEDWFDLGEQLYLANCAACHQVSGAGLPGAFPALAGAAFVQGHADEVLRLVLHGRAGMPAYGGTHDNRQIALIVSYIRNAWENKAHPVDAPMVETVHGGRDLELGPTTPTTRPGAGN